ncbi:MAG: hypothetical protein ABI678_16470, partial [Kofleriaceae bacterium]
MVLPRTLTNSPERGARKGSKVVPCLIRVLGYEAPLSPGSRHVLDGLDEIELARGPTSRHDRTGRRLRLDVADTR